MTASILPEFTCTPVNAMSTAKRSLVCGIGVNDAPYVISTKVKNKTTLCPYYRVWRGVLERCYYSKRHVKHPSYIDCTVAAEWFSFMSFRAWMETQDWKGKDIDKDILVPGNKRYSPETCLFVSHSINMLLNDNKLKRGNLPLGVSFFRRDKNYMAFISIYGKGKNLGRYATPVEAEAVYKKAKSAHIKEIASKQQEPLRSALIRHAVALLG